MKKTLILPIVAFFLSCNSKPTYTKMVETTYNFNKMAGNAILKTDTIKSDFIEADKNGSTFIYDDNGDYIINVSANPNKIEIVESETKGSKWLEERGFKITNEKIGDTLVIRYFPTKNTPSNILKFGTEYKFYN